MKDYIDITPTWSGIIRPMLEVLENNKAPLSAKVAIFEEIKRLAKVLGHAISDGELDALTVTTKKSAARRIAVRDIVLMMAGELDERNAKARAAKKA